MSTFLKELIPAVLAGIIGGVSAYTAVRVDIAVLENNQNVMKESLRVVRDIPERIIRLEGEGDFLQYQVDAIRKEMEIAKR